MTPSVHSAVPTALRLPALPPPRPQMGPNAKELFRLVEDFVGVIGFRMKDLRDAYQVTDNLGEPPPSPLLSPGLPSCLSFLIHGNRQRLDTLHGSPHGLMQMRPLLHDDHGPSGPHRRTVGCLSPSPGPEPARTCTPNVLAARDRAAGPSVPPTPRVSSEGLWLYPV